MSAYESAFPETGPGAHHQALTFHFVPQPSRNTVACVVPPQRRLTDPPCPAPPGAGLRLLKRAHPQRRASARPGVSVVGGKHFLRHGSMIGRPVLLARSLQDPLRATLRAELKERIRTARLRAAAAVNRELIQLYWSRATPSRARSRPSASTPRPPSRRPTRAATRLPTTASLPARSSSGRPGRRPPTRDPHTARSSSTTRVSRLHFLQHTGMSVGLTRYGTGAIPSAPVSSTSEWVREQQGFGRRPSGRARRLRSNRLRRFAPDGLDP